MDRVGKLAVAVVMLFANLLLSPSAAAAAPAAGVALERDAKLDALAAGAARAAVEQFADDEVKESDLAVTVIDLADPDRPSIGSFRGDEPTFPASVVKLFYLAAVHQWLEDGKLQDGDELRRAMEDMIVDSSNDATGWLLEALTDAPNGALLPEDPMRQWEHRRNAVNRYFASLGYEKINVNQKTYCEGPYGRERLFIGEKYQNRNKLTTDATARLLAEIATGRSVTPDRSRQMMDLLKRDPFADDSKGTDSQATGFTARADLPAGTKLWSKAGWTSTARHDAAYLELPDGRRLVLVIFTLNHARQRDVLPAIAKRVLEGG